MRKTVLLIDYNQDLLEILQIALRFEGLDIITAAHPEDAFMLIQKHRPHLVVLDYLLYNKNAIRVDGSKLCQQIKLNPKTSHLPVIIYSAFNEALLPLEHSGCDAFIAKPFDLTDLANQFKAIINSQLHCNVMSKNLKLA